MNQSLNSEPQEAVRYFKVGRFIVDIEAKRVSEMDGAPLEVTGKTYQLLETLVLASPSSVSVGELHARVWPGTTVSDDTVRQRVKLLRQAMGVEQGDEAYVRAEHGEGYSVFAQAVRPKVKRRSVPKYLLPFMAALVVLTPLVAFFLGSQSAAPRVFVEAFAAPEQDDARLAAGFTGELIDKLAPIRGLLVAADKSGQIAARIEGSIRHSDTNLSVSVRIVDTESGDYIWVREYEDRPAADIYDVQANIAAHVALVLEGVLDEGAYEVIANGPTSSTEAYYAYMRGRGHAQAGDFEKAQAAFQKALEVAPGFVPATEALSALTN